MIQIQEYGKQPSVPVIQKVMHHRFVFTRIIGAGGIDHLTVFFKEVKTAQKDSLLRFNEFSPFPHSAGQAFFARLSESSLPRAGNICENGIKSLMHGELLSLVSSDDGIQDTQAIEIIAEGDVPAFVEFVRYDDALVSHDLGHMGRLSTRRGAHVQNVCVTWR
jgi:hypothetical protein